ncbi:MAG: TetR/AcrR family transcriptional regulator [Vulcanimicrobiaceae bacterium]
MVKATYHHGDLRQTLVKTARALAVESGIDGFSLREVSRRAGVSHAAAYNHFADRSALVEALVVEAFRALRGALERAERRPATPLERLQNIGIAYVRFAFEHPAEFRFMFRPELIASIRPRIEASAEEASADAYEILQRTIAAARASGDIAHEADHATLTAWSIVHGLATLILDSPGEKPLKTAKAVETLARTVTTIGIDGMRVRRGGTSTARDS